MVTSLPVNSCHACAPHNTYTLPGYVLIDQHAGSFLFVGMPSINIRLIVLRCSCRCFLRISPAAELLLTRFLRQGAPPPLVHRSAPRICPLYPHAPVRGLNVRISAKSYPFSDLVHCVTLLTLGDAFFGVIPSGTCSPTACAPRRSVTLPAPKS